MGVLNALDEWGTIAAGAVLLVASLRDRNTHRRGVPHPYWPFTVAATLFSASLAWAAFQDSDDGWWWPAIPFLGAIISMVTAHANRLCNEAQRGRAG